MPQNKLFRVFFRTFTITAVLFIPWLLAAGLLNWAYVARGYSGMPLYLHVAIVLPFFYWGYKIYRNKRFTLGEKYKSYGKAGKNN